MEADVSSQEQEEEEKEAVWLREQGHCKMRSVRDHPSQDSTTAAAETGRRAARTVLGHGRGAASLFGGTSGFVWVAGLGRGGCGSRQP